MGGRFAQRVIDQETALFVADAEPVRGRFTAVKLFEHAEGGLWSVLNLATDLLTFQRVEDEQLFDFSAATISPNQQACEFHSGLPIDLELTIAPALAADLQPPFASLARRLDPTFDATLDRIVRGLAGTEPTLPLTLAANFRWLRVLQEQAHAPAGTRIKLGMRSVFAR